MQRLQDTCESSSLAPILKGGASGQPKALLQQQRACHIFAAKIQSAQYKHMI